MGSSPFSIRLSDNVRTALAEDAKRYGVAERTLAQDLIEEGLRLRRHPGITFTPHISGRRASLAARPRLSIMDVIATLRGSDSAESAAEYLGLSSALFGIALDYYQEYRSEIDAEIQERDDYAEQAEREFRERQSLLKR